MTVIANMWYWVLAGFLTIVTVVGNGLVIYLVIRVRRLHTMANWSVLSLAVADFFVGLSYFPLLFALNVDSLEVPPVRSRLFFLVTRTFLYFSATNLCVLVVDRYVAIVNPFKYLPFMTTKTIIIALATAWVTPVILFTVPFAMEVSSYFLLCFRVSVFQFVPIIVFLFVTGRIFLIMREISKRAAKIFAQLRFNHPTQNLPCKMVSSPETTATAKMTTAVMLFFIICYIAENYKCFCTVFHLCQSTAALEKTVDLLFVINSAANPVAYAFLKRDIKSALRRLIVKNTDRQRAITPGNH